MKAELSLPWASRFGMAGSYGRMVKCSAHFTVGRSNPRTGRTLMHGVAPHRCGQVARPLLGGGTGGRSPGLL